MNSLFVISLILGASARADFTLAGNGKSVVCHAADNQRWNLNKARSTVRYTVEGESVGAKKIIDKVTDGQTYISYLTEEGTLTLGNKDTWQFAGEPQAWEIECK